MKTKVRNLSSRMPTAEPTSRRLRPLTLALSCVLLTACAAVGPDYREPPPVDIGNGWTLPLASESQSADLARWWSALDDPILDRLMGTALAQNLDLRQAAARIDEARALRDRVAGDQMPTVSAGTSVNRRGQSKNGPLPVGSIPGLDATQTIYDAGFDAAWEADLFGAKRRALEGASARLQATEVEAQGVRMRIVAEVARTWFTAAGARYELHAQQATLDTLQQTLELVRLRHALGDASAADVEAAYAQWTAVNALLPDIQARQRAAVLGLGVLLGAPPERELALLDGPLAPCTLRALPVGERADLLRRRPDVLAAERRLAASSADIGVATAELFPKLSIGVGGGFQALSTGNWFDASSSRFSILPLISWRLFDGGRVRAEIRAREAAEQQAALAYEQAVLAALGDAERALGDYHGGLDTLERRAMALDAARTSYGYAKARYAAGDVALVELLAAQRSLHEAETAAARAHTSAAVQLVALYKALGGGWEVSSTMPSAAHSPTGAAAPTPRASRSGMPASAAAMEHLTSQSAERETLTHLIINRPTEGAKP
ncbi:efflux transporter outer membrane subunit [Pseudomonas aeruginosa]|uniref:efflux transporter outer membrane subunit n=1 Tax=Pseudomonadota TaxID=1224 RepID=UPI0002C9ABC9|nr:MULTISPECIES: efflux transporter outer membrane subunit [Pseudomonadota]EMZ43755.1 NodT family efflux transporter, outer membrane factor (OMF) lipoprotein [Pseudomonas aeruginosa str. Stone 130]MBE5528065.1 RND transporter [Laribacter hongkongensis]MCU9462304.1 efflux transporter outer membrane subunit [Pseudomonas aeruginosa]MCU9492943.1 efflux transporter outer membrane subunit [Pseudomonas aeruginosa]MDK3035810.1 efflux transporter outer membrane subunit [Pseudomonas aeruginosa]